MWMRWAYWTENIIPTLSFNGVVSTQFITFKRAASCFLLTTKDFIIDNYYAIMLTGMDDREIEKLTKHLIKSTNRTALHRQPLKMISFKINKKKLSYQQLLFPRTVTQTWSLPLHQPLKAVKIEDRYITKVFCL